MTSSIVMLNLIGNSSFVIENSSSFLISLIPYIAFLITLSSSFRLAKFNISDISTDFKGLPTPANAIFIVFLPKFIEYFQLETIFENIFILLVIVCLSSFLLISNLNMFSLKIKNLKFNQNKALYVLFFSSVILFASIGLSSLTIIITIYIILNLLRIVV